MITVNRCGYDSKHMVALDTCNSMGTDDYTLLLVKTEAYFEQNGKLLDTPPNTVIIYDKHSYIHYGCRMPHYNEYLIHLSCMGRMPTFCRDYLFPSIFHFHCIIWELLRIIAVWW